MADVLSSSLFTGEGIDGATSKRLEDCAQGRPNETASHIAHANGANTSEESSRRFLGSGRPTLSWTPS